MSDYLYDVKILKKDEQGNWNIVVEEYKKLTRLQSEELSHKYGTIFLDLPDPDDGFMAYVNDDQTLAMTMKWEY